MKLLTVLVGVTALLGAANADQARLIGQALDQITQFKIEDAPVVEAFEALTGETGVKTFIAPEVVELLPYGSDTRISVDFDGISLRDGMTEFLLPLGLTFEVANEGICVVPRAELLRLGRRITWAELDQLAFVREADWSTLAQQPEGLRTCVQFRVKVDDPWSLLGAAAKRIGAGPGDQVLTLACEALGWTWFPEDDKIVILSAADQIRRQLECPLSLRITHRPLVDVLQQLARKSHVVIGHEPGVLASLPIQTRQNFSLLVEGVTVGEALEQIAAATGLGYRIDNDAVVFYHPGSIIADRAKTKRAKSIGRDPYVVKLALPAGPGEVQVEILIRQSELSVEAIEARRQLVQKADEILRLQLEEEGRKQ